MKGIPVLHKPIRPQKLYEQVAHRLEARILDQTYSPGDLIPSERDLMREFGVGRPAVREALFHLKNMGLIELRSGERAMVTRRPLAWWLNRWPVLPATCWRRRMG
jgi:GntR family transcriptional regulator, sialic acid-inducible nan operon repressor